MDVNQKLDSGLSLSLFDKLFCIILLAAGTLYGKSIAIGPVAWDDTLYLHTAAALTPDPTILNRYFHIFLLRLGIAVAGGNPFSGANLAGAFTFSLTAALVYLSARLLSRERLPWHGLIAILVLLAEPFFLEGFGIPLADHTAMLMVSLAVFLYLVTIRQDRSAPVLLVLNGAIFFLAIKSKEICAVLIILLVALLVVNNRPFHWKTVSFRALAVLAGLAAGLVLFIFLDTLLLNDPWFGLRLTDFQALITFNADQAINFQRQAGSYFNLFTHLGLLAPFFLAMISAIARQNKYNQGEWAVWLLLPAFILILTVSQIKGAFGVLERYAIPSLPVLAILAAQFFQFEPPQDGKGPAWIQDVSILGLIAAASIAVYMLSLAFYALVGKTAGWSQADFFTSISEPLALCLLIPAILFLPGLKKSSTAIVLALLLFLTVPQIQIYRRVLVSGQPRQASIDRFSPMTIFKDQVACATGKIYVSSHYHDDLDLLSRDQQSSLWMFDLAFNCVSQKSQFDISPTPGQILIDRYQYAFIPKKDFDRLMATPDQAGRLQAMYSVSSDPRQAYYLLTLK